jgi:hypothetical protein
MALRSPVSPGLPEFYHNENAPEQPSQVREIRKIRAWRGSLFEGMSRIMGEEMIMLRKQLLKEG